MNGRMIDPKDVPAMFRDGTLWFGIELEFHNVLTGDWYRGELKGFDNGNYWPYVARTYLEDGRLNGKPEWFDEARFPLPDLRDGDPVLVKPYKSYKYWVHVHFSHFSANGESIKAYGEGSRWTSREQTVFYEIWRIPTQDELESAGLDRNHFAGRRGINQDG